MTEPVAYMIKEVGRTLILDKKPIWASDEQTTLLYTAEQLHPRVKMTQAEFEEWKELYYHLIELCLPVHKMLDEVLDSIGVERGMYTKLAKRVYEGNGFMSTSENQAELANLFVNYSPDNPEETIEIVHNMKWFVISKEPDNNGEYEFISGIETPDDWGYSERQEDVSNPKSCAYPFDTEEEAEKWTNPLTKAVQLPVEN